jgi:hypothetical protein
MAISRGDLVGARPGTSFTIPVVPIAGSEMIIWDGNILYPVGAFSSNPTLECVISGQNVTTGSVIAAGNKLHYICDVA